MIDAARAELVTASDPYFRGIDRNAQLHSGMSVEPARSSVQKGPRILYFDNGHGWMRYTFVQRVEDPQFVVEEIFWQ